ncbi:aminoglycoside phosphotransferase family protein [Maritimibacter sp. DP1N21-5]|uniref:aminoglycoside phosphotransferase family protein n=1 Tax=Maritimibacter sp. DP1N21-5 TaxID=2836867 RepID=UPI001C44D44B|nr:phosphotransferase [Maritimibacter sp. DP1N21-5]MBV7410982.1 phosphotransferase [Maritimibacter sp. DP1N21-5]
MTEREVAITAFLDTHGWSDATQTHLAGDASNRRYRRLRDGDRLAILMDANPDLGEDVRPFCTMARHLSAHGLSAPHIHAEDDALGLLLIEDLGNDLFASMTKVDPTRERALYLAATDTLIALHAAPLPEAPDYGFETMTTLAGLAHDWYLFGATGTKDDTAKARVQETLADAFATLPVVQPVLVLRDYHAENLLWLPDRDAPANVGLLDFQDAGIGHPAYDLMSLARDARRDVDPATTSAMIAHYARSTQTDPDDFTRACAAVSAQRNLRILGVFARLSLHYGKAHYVDLIPRTWANLMIDLAHPAFGALRQAVVDTLPAPSPQILTVLKSKCGTIPTR